jgi:hypothetical protein
MRLLVCGGRNYTNESLLNDRLSEIHSHTPVTLLIHGDARGADRLAGAWAGAMEIPMMIFPANWNLGKQAGYIRNKQMLEEGKPDLVLAFPGGRGTEMMMQLTLEAGVPLVAIQP